MNGEQIRVLIIDDEKAHAEAVAEVLERVNYECVLATSGAAGARLIEQEDFDVVLTDLRMADVDGLAILRRAKQELPDAEVVVITGHGAVQTARAALKEGAADYLEKPVDMAELRAIVDRAAERVRLAKANRELRR
ncbi:MAG TPA: response regulator, partial [Gemmataceae bacterium]|nr:response regulator [Gemmataceae bacterium]